MTQAQLKTLLNKLKIQELRSLAKKISVKVTLNNKKREIIQSVVNKKNLTEILFGLGIPFNQTINNQAEEDQALEIARDALGQQKVEIKLSKMMIFLAVIFGITSVIIGIKSLQKEKPLPESKETEKLIDSLNKDENEKDGMINENCNNAIGKDIVGDLTCKIYCCKQVGSNLECSITIKRRNKAKFSICAFGGQVRKTYLIDASGQKYYCKKIKIGGIETSSCAWIDYKSMNEIKAELFFDQVNTDRISKLVIMFNLGEGTFSNIPVTK